MKTWKIWVFGWLFVFVLVVAAVGSALWRNVSTLWDQEGNAAQYALDHTAMQKISSSTVFSGPGGVEEVFRGVDVFHRAVVAFVETNPLSATALPARTLLKRSAALAIARQYTNNPIRANLGKLTPDAQAALQTTATYVWEITYRQHGQFGYMYLDGETGKLVWWK